MLFSTPLYFPICCSLMLIFLGHCRFLRFAWCFYIVVLYSHVAFCWCHYLNYCFFTLFSDSGVFYSSVVFLVYVVFVLLSAVFSCCRLLVEVVCINIFVVLLCLNLTFACKFFFCRFCRFLFRVMSLLGWHDLLGILHELCCRLLFNVVSF